MEQTNDYFAYPYDNMFKVVLEQHPLNSWMEEDAGKGTSSDPNDLPLPDLREVKAGLAAIDPNIDYKAWFDIGCALHRTFGDNGFEIWDEWSRRGTKYQTLDQMKQTWQSLAKGNYNFNIGTVFYHADQTDPSWRDKFRVDEPRTDPPTPNGITATPFVWADPTTIPRRQWLYQPHYVRQFSSLDVSTGGVGKSSLVIVEALAMASDKPLLGVTPEGPLRVWYWNGEDPADELQRRVVAAMKHHQLTSDAIGDRLFIVSGRTMPIVIADEARFGIRVARRLSRKYSQR